MEKNKNYPTISSRDIQRNFSVLKDALADHGTVYISYYNKRLAKVVAEQGVIKNDKEVELKALFQKIKNSFSKRRKEIKDKNYDQVYHEEMMKKYG